MPKAKNAVEEEYRPKEKERDHEPVNHINHVIHLTTMGRKIFWDTEELGRTHGGSVMWGSQ